MRGLLVRRQPSSEGGFTLIEASIAMLLVAMMFTALSAGLMSGLRATRDARLFQQATSMGEEAVEAARNLAYDKLVMQTSDLTDDPRIEPGPPMKFDPDGSGSLLAEPVVAVASAGADSIVPHKTTENVLNTTFTTWRYVTWVDDAIQGGLAQSYKRMVVITEWQVGDKTNKYVTSSFIALARRGLPVPKFELLPATQTIEVDQGNVIAFPHTIRNLGIVDTYDLEMTTNPRGWVINFYRDQGQIGVFEPVTDSLLLDTNSTGVADTGSVPTDETTYFLAVLLVGPTDAPGTVGMTLTATSGANDVVTHDSTDTVVVGFAGLVLNLHNKPTPPTGDTTAQLHMAMNLAPVTDISLYKYSTNYYPLPPAADKPGGRHIKNQNASDTETSTEVMANWVYQLPAGQSIFNGTAELKVWVARKDFSCTGGPVQIRAYLRQKTREDDSGLEIPLTNGNAVLTPTGVGSCAFELVTLTMPLNVTVLGGNWLELKVTNRQTSGDPALIAYDTLTYRSRLKLPQVSSG